MAEALIYLGFKPSPISPEITAGLPGLVGVLVTGLSAIAVWIFNKIAEHRQERSRRRQSQRDVQTAILAEIDAVWRQWVSGGTFEQARQDAEARFNADVNFVPFVTPDAGIAVFPALIPQVPVLEEAEIAFVVRFYRQVNIVEGFAGEMRSSAYASLATTRRLSILLGYLRLVDVAIGMAEEAIARLEASLDIPVQDRLANRKAAILDGVLHEFNSTEAVRTDRASTVAD